MWAAGGRAGNEARQPCPRAWLMHEAIFNHLPAQQLGAGQQLTMHPVTTLKAARVTLQLSSGPRLVPSNYFLGAREGFLGTGLSAHILAPSRECAGFVSCPE